MDVDAKIALGSLCKEWKAYMTPYIKTDIDRMIEKRIKFVKNNICTLGPDYDVGIECIHFVKGYILKIFEVFEQLCERKKRGRYPKHFRLLFDPCIFDIPNDIHEHSGHDSIATINFIIALQHQLSIREDNHNWRIVMMCTFNMFLMYLINSKHHDGELIEIKMVADVIMEKIIEARKELKSGYMPDVLFYNLTKNCDVVEKWIRDIHT